MAKIIAVILPKGGVGKTVTAVNLAASLAVAEQRTLLIDLDTIGSSGLSFGLTEGRISAGLYEIFNFLTTLPRAIHKTELSHLDVIPSNITTLQREERMARLADNRSILKNCLRAVQREYEYIILDCPPFLRGLTTNALTAADSVLIPVKSGHFSLDAVDKLFKYLDWIREVANRQLAVEGILLTMHEPNTRVTDITTRELQGKYRKHMLPFVIPKNTVLSEASFYGKPAILYNAGSRGATAYLNLARAVMERTRREAANAVPVPGERGTGSHGQSQ
jgi:chromosome partitioning protein